MLIYYDEGRLAQLVERNIDVVDVTGSSPVSPTNIKEVLRYLFYIWEDDRADCSARVKDSKSFSMFLRISDSRKREKVY